MTWWSLAAAGAIIVGKTNVAELGYGAVGHNPVFPTTRNPWALDRTSGGSSAGSAAAVAAGLAPIALGSDGGGSIRIPAALCGIVGSKPSMAAYRFTPDVATSASLDFRVGSRLSTSGH
jgi:aspartyl-tRNA(Asn)/glutamyl-tRNA(Gln) amidotransferase subunit A